MSRIRGRVWQRIRARILQRDCYLCVPCLAEGKTTPAEEVDHVIPLSAGGDNKDGNLQAICKDCHQRKSDEESSGQAVSETPAYIQPVVPLTVVCGPLYSGAEQKAEQLGGVLVSPDRIARETYGRHFHKYLPQYQYRSVVRARNRAINRAVSGKDGATHCVLVTPADNHKERLFWSRIADVVRINYDKDECILRAHQAVQDAAERELVIESIKTYGVV